MQVCICEGVSLFCFFVGLGTSVIVATNSGDSDQSGTRPHQPEEGPDEHQDLQSGRSPAGAEVKTGSDPCQPKVTPHTPPPHTNTHCESHFVGFFLFLLHRLHFDVRFWIDSRLMAAVRVT